jgi:hypothetical protein
MGDGGKQVEAMGVLGVLTTIGGFIAGAVLIVPRLRAVEDLPPVAWPIAAALLFLVVGSLGMALDRLARNFRTGYQRGRSGQP